MKKLLILFVLILSILDANIDEAKKAYYNKDFRSALSMLQQLRKGGNIESNYYLGTMYYFAYGVTQDYKKAFEYYTVASNQPNGKRIKSIFNLASMSILGQGIKQNYKKAFYFFKILDNENIGVAQYQIGIMYENGYGIKQESKKAIIYMEKGCKNNYPKACYYAGDYYEKGIAVEQNYSIAKKYYKKGCEAGIQGSCEAIKKMQEPLSFYKKYWLPLMIFFLLIYVVRVLIDKYKERKL